jgi:hypothetical protein
VFYLIVLLIVAVTVIVVDLVMSDRALRRYASRLEENQHLLAQKIFECKLLTQQLENRTAECDLLGQHLEQVKKEIVSLREQVQAHAQSHQPVPEMHPNQTPENPNMIDLGDTVKLIESFERRLRSAEELIDSWRKTYLHSKSA